MLRRALFLMIVCGLAAFIVLGARLFQLQLLQHEELESAAAAQQLRRTPIPARRGTITDRNGRVLAVSATTYTVYLSPAEIQMYGEDPAEIAAGLAALLNRDAAEIAALCTDTSSWYKTVARKLDADTADAVRAFKTGHDLHGVKIETDTGRYYPYSSLAAQLIGFVGTDNTGLSGAEYTLNDTLTGKNGQILRLKNSAGSDMLLTGYEDWVDAEDGADVELTLDVRVQYALEKHLKQAVIDYGVSNGAAGIAVDPRTGEILAMASLGSFDLNDYQSISAEEMMKAEAAGAERGALIAAAQQRQWRNKAISDTYEPGSTFKIITLAMALEEGVVNKSSGFYCGGSMSVIGRGKPLKCWKTAGHGSQTLTQAAQHSCNVAFATIGLRLGEETFYRYAESFGFFRSGGDSSARLTGKTGIALPGESGSIWWSRDVFCNPENLSQLAAASFGQTFNITPLQLIMAVSACCNGGTLMEPMLVRRITAADGTVTEKEPVAVRQVISAETSHTVNEILEQVVCDRREGTGKNAYVAGYSIAGKTGTSEKVAQDVSGGEKEYIVSFIGYAPANDPQIAVLVLLDTPSNESGIYISGGQMAAPVVGNILSDVLPALGVFPDYNGEESELMDRRVPGVTGLSVTEAEAQLREAGFTSRVSGSGGTVVSQLPGKGALVAAGTTVILCTEEAAPQSVTVPTLTGLSYREARDRLGELGLFLRTANGLLSDAETVHVLSQSLAPGESAAQGTVLRVTLVDENAGDLGRY